jgi:hypothetical protein
MFIKAKRTANMNCETEPIIQLIPPDSKLRIAAKYLKT